MKMINKRGLFFKIGAIIILVAIAAVMMIIGRGHTVYVDNKKIDYNGQTFESPYKVEMYVNGERVAKLYDGERGSAICIGQTFKMTLQITQKKGDDVLTTTSCVIKLPRSLDGIVINLNGLLNGLPQDVWMEEFISTVVEEAVDEEVPSSEDFAMGDI